MTLERHYAAVAFVGQHAEANTRGGVMSHSYSSLAFNHASQRQGDGRGGNAPPRWPSVRHAGDLPVGRHGGRGRTARIVPGAETVP